MVGCCLEVFVFLMQFVFFLNSLSASRTRLKILEIVKLGYFVGKNLEVRLSCVRYY